MINPLTPAEVVGAIGRAARDAAASEGPLDDFARGQLKSAYSGSRHLAAEVATFAPELRSFGGGVADAVVAAARPDLEELAGAIGATADPYALGPAVCDLLDRLREDPSPAAVALRAEVRTALRALCDREVELMADAIEGPR